MWWSRFAQPKMHAWAPSGEPFRLIEREADSDEEDPKALACYGVYLPTSSTEEDSAERSSSEKEKTAGEDAESDMLLRFVKGRPVSEVTTTFLEWVCDRLDERGTDVWALIWDQASWHTSHKVQNWIHQHNKQVKKEGGVRILACQLPSKSPWLNPIEPKWLHGKRAICQPDGELRPEDVVERVHAYYDCKRAEPIPKDTD
ncbi:transposase [Salinibacter ruber]|uniref:transposase n=1 Tax=Salinibacter ruber TaxID=146919 RepID=UPI002072CA5A|nr:transposase [Salinibacter ruber]